EIKALEHFENFTSSIVLETLILSYNNFNGSLPNWLYKLKSLKFLDLSSLPSFQGEIPTSFVEFPSLEVLLLRDNQLSGLIPMSLGRLSTLRVLDLSYNQLSGQIPMSIGKLSKLNSNHLCGQIPMSFGKLSNLKVLYLGSNQLNGTLPETLGQLLQLTKLDLFNNSFSGIVSETGMKWFDINFVTKCLWLSRLEFIVRKIKMYAWSFRVLVSLRSVQEKLLGSGRTYRIRTYVRPLKQQTSFGQDVRTQLGRSTICSFSVSELHFAKLSKLKVLDLSMNHNLSLKVRFDWLPPFRLLSINLNNVDVGTSIPLLGLSKNHTTGTIPNSLCKMHSLLTIDLAKNHLSGVLPRCWSDLQLELDTIDFASNNLSGTIPSSFGQLPMLTQLRLSNNHFDGQLPSGLKNCTSLLILDLGENNLSGEIPNWIGESMLSLKILRLRSNQFNDSVSSKLCHLNELQILDIASNNLSKTIPWCFGHLTAMMFNQIIDDPYVYNNDIIRRPLRLTQVIKGREDEYFNILPFVINVDLSSNNFIGQIPGELTKLSGLINLNLSRNQLVGSIPKNIGKLKSLESLDFSWNHLSGTIPESVSLLSGLSYLNLSQNNLSGRIQSGPQLQTLIDPYIYIGNNQLCGQPLEKKCIGDEVPQAKKYPDQKVEEGEEHGFITDWFYIGMALGCVVGFWSFKNWRYAYFRFVDDVQDWITFAIRTRKIYHKESI
ncbi:hypothetical protein AQUCO_00100777v1, partial [Aquilegia coerulea]